MHWPPRRRLVQIGILRVAAAVSVFGAIGNMAIGRSIDAVVWALLALWFQRADDY